MKKLALMAALLIVAAPAAIGAQDAPKAANVSGAWESTIETPQGPGTSTLTLKQDGESITGTEAGQMGEIALKGSVKGDTITYALTLDFGGQQFTLTYTGKVNGDAISGTVDFGGMASGAWTAKRKK